MSVPARVAVAASAAQAAGRSVAIPDLHPGAVHDCQLASDRDFLTAMAVMERPVLLALRGVRVQQPQDGLQKAAYRPVPLVSWVLWIE
jgi:hypothetical protein